MNKKVCIITLGCKVNKYESDSIAKSLESYGYETSEELGFADYYIINTCAVTNEAEKKSRQYISKINKINDNAHIIICGCGAEKHKDEYLKKKNVKAVFNFQRKDLIIKYLNQEEYSEKQLECFNSNLVDPKIIQARAYIKIQDGCNRFCSYCIIPYVRGRSVSRDLDSIITEATQLSKVYKEIVVVGIDMSDYRINGKLALQDVMKSLAGVKSRIRLGSLEVSVINQEFMEILSKMPNFAPQFHLSLQSGDDYVLSKMNRKYTSDEYLKAVELIYRYFPNANITTDIIVGFPYESEEAFNNTLKLAKKVKFGKIHCFPFSAKKGTIAYTYKEIPIDIKRKRMEMLENVANELQINYCKQYIGKELNLLIEEIEDKYYVGYSENYIKCYIKKDCTQEIGEIVKVVGKRLYKEGLEVK